jgi:hypothetical protein
MQTPLSGAIGGNPFGAISVPSALMVIYAFLYLMAALALAIRIFKGRDL